jgi:DoxX-like family
MTSEKKAKPTYWTVTAPFVATMMLAGLMLLAGAASNVKGITHLGYPIYICKILGVAKELAGIAILYERSRTLKEWAYAGYTFNLLGASASPALYGDPFIKIRVPIIILALVLASYRLWKNSLHARANRTPGG